VSANRARTMATLFIMTNLLSSKLEKEFKIKSKLMSLSNSSRREGKESWRISFENPTQSVLNLPC
jgi:hypothetical protein